MKTVMTAEIPRLALRSLLLAGILSATALAVDLSKYRDFKLGADLPTIARQTGANVSEAKIVHQRPALIQELPWRPQPLSGSLKTEPAQEVVFSFYKAELYRIVVNYDRYETEGLTTGDLVEAISAAYGTATKPPAMASAAQRSYEDQAEVLARWQDTEYRFDLIRSSYGPTFKLVGVLKRLEAPVQAAIVEAKRLDDKEAPQRDAARVASEEVAARAKLDKARVVNKPNFRP